MLPGGWQDDVRPPNSRGFGGAAREMAGRQGRGVGWEGRQGDCVARGARGWRGHERPPMSTDSSSSPGPPGRHEPGRRFLLQPRDATGRGGRLPRSVASRGCSQGLSQGRRGEAGITAERSARYRRLLIGVIRVRHEQLTTPFLTNAFALTPAAATPSCHYRSAVFAIAVAPVGDVRRHFWYQAIM